MPGYFTPLADALPPGAVEAAEQAFADYNHRGAGRRDEPALMHGIRALVEFVRADERATAEAAAEQRHQSLKAHYERLEADAKQVWRDAAKRVGEESGEQLRKFAAVHDLALTARGARRKTMPVRDVAKAVGLDMDGWE